MAQTTATKTSILRQFSNAAQRLHDLSATPDTSSVDSAKHDSKVLTSKSAGSQPKEGVKRALDDNKWINGV